MLALDFDGEYVDEELPLFVGEVVSHRDNASLIRSPVDHGEPVALREPRMQGRLAGARCRASRSAVRFQDGQAHYKEEPRRLEGLAGLCLGCYRNA